MNPSRLFILRPVATSLLMAAILLAGAIAYRLLPLSALPEVDYPTIQVVTFYPGASPDVTTSSITAPLERQFGQMPGLKQMSSTSSGGASVITLQFSLELTLDVAEQEVQAAINAASNFLPADLPAPPVYSKVNPADAPILTLGITSKTMPLPQVQNLVDTRLAQKLSQLPGGGLVPLPGGQRQPGANVIEVVDRVKGLLPQLTASLPASVEVATLTDRTVTIRASVKDVQFELMLAVALVVMVIFLFLRTAAGTLIPSIAVPLSLVGTFGVMYLAGFSVNNLTLMALTIATGFVVDDAIVMIENIARYVEEGMPPLEAALKGAEQIGFTIISLTFSLIAVLIPLLFMGDVVGRLFREFAITLAVAILISAVVSLTLTPMMCAKLLRRRPESEQGRFYRAAGRFIDSMIARYGAMLNWVLDRQTATLWVFIGTLALSVILYVVVPKGFFPLQDTGVIQGISEAPQSVSFAAMAERQRALAEAILQDPAVESVSSFIGVDGVNATLNNGRVFINLKPRSERGADVAEVMQRLQPRIARVQGISLYMQPVQDLTIEDRVSRTQYQLTVEDANPDELAVSVHRLVDRLAQLPQLADVASDLQDQGLQAFVSIDRDTAGRLGITPAAIDIALYNAFGQRLISTIFTQSNQYRVVLEVKPEFRHGPDALKDIYVASSSGAQVPLSALTRVTEKPALLAVNHLGQFPAATLSFNLAPGASLGSALQAIEAQARSLDLPASMRTSFQGAALAFRASLANELLLILAAIVTMYIVLGVLYESYIHPLTILSTLPSAGVWAPPALMLTRSDLGIIAVIGIILLIGIVKKNAIMMIDFALDAERNDGMSPRDATYHACPLRVRPIPTTTLSALLGALPLALGTGAGSELRHPLGITMVGGLILSQALTLFSTPVIYLWFDRLARRLGGQGAAGASVKPVENGRP